jgi:hypothetical protein
LLVAKGLSITTNQEKKELVVSKMLTYASKCHLFFKKYNVTAVQIAVAKNMSEKEAIEIMDKCKKVYEWELEKNEQ